MKLEKKLAETLQIPFYDNEQISILAQKEGISKELLADAEKNRFKQYIIFSF